MVKLRAFIAVPLTSAVRDELVRIQQSFSHARDRSVVRWVRPEGIHLTLKFLGDVPAEAVPKIEAALGAVSRNAPAFDIRIGGTGCFPNPRRPRVIWVGVDEPSGRLLRLQRAVEEGLYVVGFPPERRRFTPHLTLGRINRRATQRDRARVGEYASSDACGEDVGTMPVDHFALIRSFLKPTGAEYTTLATFRLRAP
jgi:2'-5' RNA ligase